MYWRRHRFLIILLVLGLALWIRMFLWHVYITKILPRHLTTSVLSWTHKHAIWCYTKLCKGDLTAVILQKWLTLNYVSKYRFTVRARLKGWTSWAKMFIFTSFYLFVYFLLYFIFLSFLIELYSTHIGYKWYYLQKILLYLLLHIGTCFQHLKQVLI